MRKESARTRCPNEVALQWLHDGPRDGLAPKAAALARAAVAGLPVPPGFAVGLDEALADPEAIVRALAELLAQGPVIVRSALAGEDDDGKSGAGLGISQGGCRSPADVRAALVALRDHRADPLLERYFGARSSACDHVIVQRQIDARCILVAAIEPAGAHVEVHPPTGDPLASGSTPTWTGPPSAWPDAAAAELDALLAATVRVAPPSPHGRDLEIVVDVHDTPWLVQDRPLVAPLHPGWPAFLAEVQRRGEADAMQGSLVLDAEHNPAPLSPAHAWLVRSLAMRRPGAGGLVVLAGWLYTRTLVRDLAGTRPAPVSPRAVLRRLHTAVLPAARERLAAIERRAAAPDADAMALQNVLADACLAFFAMIDVYLDELIPARRGRVPRATSPDDPLELRARARDLDVLPATWDVASPPLSARASATLPDDAPVAVDDALDDDVAATLLREWDDHLFALGLAPVRAAWLAIGGRLGLGDDVFLLGGDELVAQLALVGRARGTVSAADALADVVATRRAEGRRSAALHPPPRIVDGRPAGPPARALHGMPIGPSHAGPIAQRHDLGDLQARPPAPGAIVVLPTLTAQAALVVHALGLRAVVCEWGGALSHAALIARELGLSALVGCRDATRVADGASAILDTVAGRLRLAR